MCQFDDGFILCTCAPEPKPVVHNKKSRRHKHKPDTDKQELYHWALDRYVGPAESSMVGLYWLPQHDIGKGLNSEWVLLNLNCGNCFDFEYTPVENDSLQIWSENPRTYLSFLYKNGTWIMDKHSPFTVQTKLLLTGIVKKANA